MSREDRIGLMAAIIAAGRLQTDGQPADDVRLAQRAVSVALRIELQIDDFRDRRIDSKHLRACNKE